MNIGELTEFVRNHRCYSHPLFHNWRDRKPGVMAVGALFHHISGLCEASRLPHNFPEGLKRLAHTAECDILQDIVTSEEDHGPQLAARAGHIVNKAGRECRFSDLGAQGEIEKWLKECSSYFFGRLPGYQPDRGQLAQDRAVEATFARRAETDAESTYKNVGTLLAIEMLANNQIIPGEYHCLVHSGLYDIDISEPALEYLREHGGEDGGAEEWHEEEAIKAVAGVLNDDTTDAIVAGATECLESIAALWDVLDATLLN